jgi:hypothetical protein
MRNDITKVSFSRGHAVSVLANAPLVIYQCALQRDLSLFDAGDKAEVGEKGLTIR